MKRNLPLPLLVLLGICILSSNSLTAQTFSLLKDINPGGLLPTEHSSNPRLFTVGDAVVYFVADDGVNGFELWKTNGTEAGTLLVKDINAGVGSANPSALTLVNNILFFRADDGVNGIELWKTDGTDAGTVLVKDIHAGIDGSVPNNLFFYNDKLFFGANDGSTGNELWQSDGTEAGTTLVKDINPAGDGIDSATVSNKVWFTILKGELFFAASDGSSSDPAAHGVELWKTDGTSFGTILVKDIFTGTTASIQNSSSPNNLKVIADTIYFAATDALTGTEFWKTDGTTIGTVLVKDINPGSDLLGAPKSSSPAEFTAYNNQILFSAFFDELGRELWKSDGSDAGTNMVADIYPSGDYDLDPNAPLIGYSSNPNNFIVFNNLLYFAAKESSGGNELYRSDGTTNGTFLDYNLAVAADDGDPRFFNVVDDTLFFTANSANGRQLWKKVGATTPAVVPIIQDYSAGSDELLVAFGKLYLVPNTVDFGWEPWVSNLSGANPVPLHFLEFKAEKINSNALLSWTTENEINTASFDVECSHDGIDFVKIGSVKANNQDGVQAYSFIDSKFGSTGNRIVYYRLKQIDLDNQFTYSKILSLNNAANQTHFVIFPNPVQVELIISSTLQKAQRIRINIYSQDGKLIRSSYHQLSNGASVLSVPMSGIRSGSYIVEINGADIKQTLKIIKR